MAVNNASKKPVNSLLLEENGSIRSTDPTRITSTKLIIMVRAGNAKSRDRFLSKFCIIFCLPLYNLKDGEKQQSPAGWAGDSLARSSVLILSQIALGMADQVLVVFKSDRTVGIFQLDPADLADFFLLLNHFIV